MGHAPGPRSTRLPPWAVRLLQRLAPGPRRDVIVGDFAEVFAYIAQDEGRSRALRWYGAQVLRSLPSFLSDGCSLRGTMLYNYLKVALRLLQKHKGYAAINIAGLALGLACCLLILLYVQDERSYDRFYPDAERIYRVAVNEVTPTSNVDYPLTPVPMAAALADDYPEISDATRASQRQSYTVGYEDRRFDETRIHRVDSNFFQVFRLPFLQGDPLTALSEPSTVVLTAATAEKYFGQADPIGKVILIKDGISYSTPYTVTGVLRDLPPNTHFPFDILTSWWREGDIQNESSSWLGYGVYTYLLVPEGGQGSSLEAKLPAMVERYMAPQIEAEGGVAFSEHLAAGNGYRFFLQPLTDIHLYSNTEWEIAPSGSITYVYLFAAIALFILLLACVNYMNLATARSARRMKEMGLRKVLGSARGQLMAQVLTESTVMTVVALALALVLVRLVQPAFNGLAGKDPAAGLEFGVLVPSFLGLMLVVGLLAGSYPAFFLSAFRPAVVLNGAFHRRPGTTTLRNGLVVFQFATSMILLVGTIVVYRQIDYMLTKDLGFDREHVVIVEKAWALGNRREAFKQVVLANPNVLHTTAANALPGRSFMEWFISPEHAEPGEQYNVSIVVADHDYAQTLGLDLVRGRLFDPDRPTDSTAVVVNEALVRMMGLRGDPLGQRIGFGNNDQYPIIGVVRDFHYKSLHHAVQPLAYFIAEGTTRFAGFRIRPQDARATLDFLEASWTRFVPEVPFSYAYVSADVEALYRAEARTKTLFSIFALLAIVIASLGLLGLTAFVTEQRTKEIGVRKVLGATAAGVVLLFSRDFLRLVLFAFVVAAPLAYLAMSRWLDGFAYRVTIAWWVLPAAGSAVLLVAGLTVCYQAARAARTNPVEALRYE